MNYLIPSLVGLLVWTSSVYAQTSTFPDFITLVEQNSAAVVSIDTTGERSGQPGHRQFPPIPEDSPFYDYFKRFFEQNPNAPRRRSLTATGSGFIISTDGYILTNAHVVDGADKINVGLSDRTELSAKVIGTDQRSDIALLKVDATGLPAVKIGDAKALKVGQWVLAIGSPFGFDHTATQGIISSLGRNLPSGNYVSFIQTDAAVNPGNSGGPLFNLDGEVIGINSQIYSRSGGYQGVSFAIPIDLAMDVVDQLKTTGRVSRGWLGVLIQEVTAELAESFGLDKPRGALVGQVLENSPAQKAGLKVGDIIIAFNGQAVATNGELPPLVGRVRPGNEATVTLIRDGKELTLSVKIEELPSNLSQRRSAPEPTSNRLKVTVADPEPDTDTEGVIVREVEDGPAAQAGIQAGDLILRINKEEVTSRAQFEDLIKDLPAGKPVPILVQRGENALFLALTIPKDE